MEQQKQIPLLVVVGPTASGKTRLAVALAKRFGGEVVSADSMQVYKSMQIATAKPSPEEQEGISHHLVDFVEPDNAAFSVADYARLARAAIADIFSRGRLPILAGGTGLYINAVINQIDYAEIKSDSAVRKALQEQALQLGNEAMLEQLRRVDPVLAAGLHPNNLGRILRALEVWQLTGVAMSEHQRLSKQKESPYQLCILGLNYRNRELLYQRINQRVELMLEQGLVEEARQISRIYGGTARQAIGYKELQPYLDGKESLSVCVEQLKQATRNYAKRQLTWFRRDSRIHWLFADDFSSWKELLEIGENIVHEQLKICYNGDKLL
ncbi:MAG: tRNA (adenosine(37)-N6)-dimethylallyltransferase MiaA [Anaerotruncus sp.]|nr:tRNA (adenosine(37)-N6)-dimethylallyltransferase MiaA [Anaerotruncus sp.]